MLIHPPRAELHALFFHNFEDRIVLERGPRVPGQITVKVVKMINVVISTYDIHLLLLEGVVMMFLVLVLVVVVLIVLVVLLMVLMVVVVRVCSVTRIRERYDFFRGFLPKSRNSKEEEKNGSTTVEEFSVDAPRYRT